MIKFTWLIDTITYLLAANPKKTLKTQNSLIKMCFYLMRAVKIAINVFF